MCGLVFTTRGAVRFNQLLAAVKHRGPDASTVAVINPRGNPDRAYYRRGGFLGHTRLAIVGLSEVNAEQPLISADSATAFNGEIFNYQDLSDLTEVGLLNELFQTRKQVTRLLNGYYGVIHIDYARNELTLARDPVGVIPLYYSRGTADGTGPEVKGPQFEVCSERRHLTGKVVEVQPGETLRFSMETWRLKSKFVFDPWMLDIHTFSHFRGERLFEDAVRRVAEHTDVGFDLALSGGLDSTMLLHMLNRVRHLPKKAYTVSFLPYEDDEVGNARMNANRFKVPWELIRVTAADVAAEAERVVEHLETPIYNPIKVAGFLRHYFIAKHAKSKVILCGEGADELDAGYPSHMRRGSSYAQLAMTKLSIFRSQSAMTLDRVNKSGMAWGKEYRVPYLDLDFARYMLSVFSLPGKQNLKRIADLNFVNQYNAKKYSSQEDVGRSDEFLAPIKAIYERNILNAIRTL